MKILKRILQNYNNNSDNSIFYVAIIFILIPGIFFCVFVGPQVISRISIYLFLCFIYFWLASLISLWMTHISDPGIIPKKKNEQNDNSFDIFENSRTETPLLSKKNKKDNSDNSNNSPKKQIVINGETIELKWCKSCHIFRPPRASHCSDCNHCCENYDHHCPWVGNCVGKRNYRYFLFFVYSTTLLCIFSLMNCAMILYSIAKESIKNDSQNVLLDVIIQSPASIILGFYAFFILLSISCLSCFHTYLVTTGQTTHEEFTLKKNPFRTNCFENWKNVCCPTSLPSYIYYENSLYV